MGETNKHRVETMNSLETLESFFADQPLVFVSGDDFIYYEEGNNKKFVSPDCWVAFGVEKRLRDCYKVWEEGGHLPDVVIEFTSKSTRKADTETKFRLYEQFGTSEYFLFDPTGDYLNPRLQGWRLRESHYVPIEWQKGRLYSEQLGLDLTVEDEHLRFYNPQTGERLLIPQEKDLRIEELEQQAEVEARRAEMAEAENARLRAAIEALRKQTGE
jgi:Uma2 family endonuclease